VNESTGSAGRPDFYSARYSNERQKLRDVVFSEVYENYFGQSSWVSTADYDRFTEWLGLKPESTLLDIACGSGQPALRIAAATGCTVAGIDFSGQAIVSANRLAEERGLSARARFQCADASGSLPYATASFDAVTCIDALAHFPERPAAFTEWWRVLKPLGRLVFTTQALTGLISNAEFADRTPFGYYSIGPADYDERLMSEAGFRLQQRVDLTATFVEIAERHCAARATNGQALRAAEGEHEFNVQNRYRAVAAKLARERRLSHFAYIAQKTGQ
jgi:SAM-dependent methyltransferase